jgi:manganese/iron transport system substrate-binding protein
MKFSISVRMALPQRHPSLKIVTPIVIFGLLTSCQPQIVKQPGAVTPPATSQSTTGTKPKVVVTNTVLCDLTHQIAASSIELTCLLSPGSDPHIYQLTPAARQSIEDAQLLMYGGYNLEPELTKAITATANSAPKIAVNEVAIPQPQQFTEDGKSTIDPHVWHNAQNGIKLAEVIAVNLAKLVPDKAAIYKQNTQKLTSEITSIDRWMRSQINTIPVTNKVLVTTHDSLGYYAKAYGLSIATLGGISTEEKPNAARAKELIDRIKKTQVPTIYAELNLNPSLIKTIAKEANVKVSEREIYADGLGEVGSSGATYQKMLIANTQAIVAGLGGKYTPFTVK